jgi:hypothetical protein
MKILMGKDDDEVLLERENEHFIDYISHCFLGCRFSNMISLCFLRFVIQRCESFSSYVDTVLIVTINHKGKKTP